MNRQKFLRQFRKAYERLDEVNKYTGRRENGVCSVLGLHLRGNMVRREFTNLFEPSNNSLAYWLGPLNNDIYLEKRRIALLLFKEYCLESQIYRSYDE